MGKSEAQTLLEKADKKANSSGGWFSSSTTKYEEAGDMYQQAGNAFKIDKLFKEAGDAFAREAECREKCKEVNEAANAWWNASKAYKRGYPDRASCLFLHHYVRRTHLLSLVAVQALSQTITALTRAGRFRQAADREKEIAQIHLQETNDLRKACESFERAADWYAQEDATAYVSITSIHSMSFGSHFHLLPFAERRTHASRTLRTCMPISKNTLLPSSATSRSPTTLLRQISPSTA